MFTRSRTEFAIAMWERCSQRMPEKLAAKLEYELGCAEHIGQPAWRSRMVQMLRLSGRELLAFNYLYVDGD